jgi:hypothetical protein
MIHYRLTGESGASEIRAAPKSFAGRVKREAKKLSLHNGQGAASRTRRPSMIVPESAV